MQKCTICNGPAPYMIKDTSTFYCQEHAEEFFGDVSYLAKAELANAQDGADAIRDLLNAEDNNSDE